MKAGEDYVQLRCSDKFAPHFQALAFETDDAGNPDFTVIDAQYLYDRTQDGPDVSLKEHAQKVSKELTNSLRNRRLIDMAITWVLPALYSTFETEIAGAIQKLVSSIDDIPWVNELFSFTGKLSGALDSVDQTPWISSLLGKQIDTVQAKIDPQYRQGIFGNATTPSELLSNLIVEKSIPWLFDRVLGIDFRSKNMIINILSMPGETQFFDRIESGIGGIQQKYEVMEKYVEQLMSVVEMFLTIFGQKEAAIQIQETVSEIWETFSYFFNQVVETASSFLEETKGHIGQMAGSDTVPAIESAMYGGNMDSMIGIIGNRPIQLIDKYTGGGIRAIFQNDFVKYGLGLLFGIIKFAIEGFDFQGLINELVQGLDALGLNFDSNTTNFSDLGNLTSKVAGKSPFTSIIFRELRGAFISMGMADITLDGLFQYFIELCHMNFFPLEQIFNILWTITKLVLKVYVGGVFCTVVKQLINGIIMAILKHFLNQAMGVVFAQVGILNLGESTVTDLSGFTSEKIAGRMTAA